MLDASISEILEAAGTPDPKGRFSIKSPPREDDPWAGCAPASPSTVSHACMRLLYCR